MATNGEYRKLSGNSIQPGNIEEFQKVSGGFFTTRSSGVIM